MTVANGAILAAIQAVALALYFCSESDFDRGRRVVAFGSFFFPRLARLTLSDMSNPYYFYSGSTGSAPLLPSSPREHLANILFSFFCSSRFVSKVGRRNRIHNLSNRQHNRHGLHPPSTRSLSSTTPAGSRTRRFHRWSSRSHLPFGNQPSLNHLRVLSNRDGVELERVVEGFGGKDGDKGGGGGGWTVGGWVYESEEQLG